MPEPVPEPEPEPEPEAATPVAVTPVAPLPAPEAERPEPGGSPRVARRAALAALATVAVIAAAVGFVVAPTSTGPRAKATTPPKTTPSGPVLNQSYATGLNTIMARVDKADAAATHSLDTAHTPAQQAAAARTIGKDDLRASGQISALTPGATAATANAQISSALNGLGTGYEALGQAAQHNDKRAYASATTSIHQSEAQLTRAYAQLKKDGYTVGGA